MATPGVFKELGLMTTSEAAAIVGVHRATIWNAIQQGHIPTKLIGNSNALRLEDVATFRDNYLRLKVTSTSAGAPAKKGRPPGSKNLLRVVVEPPPAEAPPAETPMCCVCIIFEAANEQHLRELPPTSQPVAAGACPRCGIVMSPPSDLLCVACGQLAEAGEVLCLACAQYAVDRVVGPTVTNCSACSAEIPDTEVQMCEHCGEDGLGNCCIGIGEHDCVRPSDCG